jgi:predicted nucleic acid binding AN1-type Zn finger protein
MGQEQAAGRCTGRKGTGSCEMYLRERSRQLGDVLTGKEQAAGRCSDGKGMGSCEMY